jgi:uncharacterized membrane protein YuzA (DUF378 family)
MKALHMIAWILVIIGGLDWLVVGITGSHDLVMYLGASLARVVYILVGLSAIYELFTHKANCKMCGTGGNNMAKPTM